MTKNKTDHFAGFDIKPGETFVDAVCRTISLDQRTAMGSALRRLSLALEQANNEKESKNDESK